MQIFSISKKRVNEIRDLFSTDFVNSGCNQIELLEAIVLDMIGFKGEGDFGVFFDGFAKAYDEVYK